MRGQLLIEGKEPPVLGARAAEQTRAWRLGARRAEAVAGQLPHRERVLLINHRLARRILDAHAAWLDEAEAELRGAAARRR